MEAQANPANSVLLWLKASSKRNKIQKLHLWHRLVSRSCKWKIILNSPCSPFLSLPKQVHITASASKESTRIPKYINLIYANMKTSPEAFQKAFDKHYMMLLWGRQWFCMRALCNSQENLLCRMTGELRFQISLLSLGWSVASLGA